MGSYYLDRRYLLRISSRLRNFKQKRSTLWNASCILCGDSQTNQLKARLYFYEAHNSIRVKCHHCGVNLSFGQLLKTLDQGLHREYVMEKFRDRNARNAPIQQSPTPEPTPVISTASPLLTCITDLPDDHYAKQYIQARQIPSNRWSEIHYTNDFKQYMDATYPNHGKDTLHGDDPRLIWFMTDLHGKVTHVCGRGLSAEHKLRYIKIRVAGGDNDQKIFGWDHLIHTNPLYVVEGELDSCMLDDVVASGDSSLETCANSLWVRFKDQNPKVVLIWDCEPRNREIIKQMEKAIINSHHIVIWPENMPGKDLNEFILNGMTKNQLNDIIKKRTFNGAEALLMFNKWKKW